MKKSYLEELLDQSRLLEILHGNLPAEISSSILYSTIQAYVEKYAIFNGISAERGIAIYTAFIGRYNKHCKRFAKTGEYPFEYEDVGTEIRREEYDIVLLLSVLFTPHRYRIMELLSEKNTGDTALFIGLGPGLELSLTQAFYKQIHSYDLSVSKFLYHHFPGININKELYTGQQENFYDSVYLIELLEHVENPYDLLRICYASLKKGGLVYLTTATDIPQFDHLYKFPLAHSAFEERVGKMGFKILKKEHVPHNYLIMNLKPSNHFYLLQKTP